MQQKEFDEFQRGVMASTTLQQKVLPKLGNFCTTNGLCVGFIHDRCQNLSCSFLHDASKIRPCDHFARGTYTQITHSKAAATRATTATSATTSTTSRSACS